VYEPKNNGDLLTAPGNSDTLKATGGTDFYVAPGGEAIPAAYESWIGENQRDAVLTAVEDKELGKIVEKAYDTGSVIGNGTYAAKIRFYQNTGYGKINTKDYTRLLSVKYDLERILDTGDLCRTDREVALVLYQIFEEAWR